VEPWRSFVVPEQSSRPLFELVQPTVIHKTSHSGRGSHRHASCRSDICARNTTKAGAREAASRLRDEEPCPLQPKKYGFQPIDDYNTSKVETAFFIYGPAQLDGASAQEYLKYRPYRLVDLRGNPRLTLSVDDRSLARHTLIGVQGSLGPLVQGGNLARY
jgi:hypothetical protein